MREINGENYLSEKEVAEFFGVSKSTIANWRHTGKPPQAYKMSGIILYKQCETESAAKSMIKKFKSKKLKTGGQKSSKRLFPTLSFR